MTPWTLLICEGAHDQAFLSAICETCLGWNAHREMLASLPEDVARTVPRPTRNRIGFHRIDLAPNYLVKAGRYMVIRSLGSVEAVLGRLATDLVDHYRPPSLGVFADADDKSVESRQTAFRNRFRELFAHADRVSAGKVIRDRPTLGLWIAPTNRASGTLDDTMIATARVSHAKLVTSGKRFVSRLRKLTGNPGGSKRNQAILATIHQGVRPGSSLAVGLSATKCWLTADSGTKPHLRKLVRFIDQLTR